jgi:hypothetical protein
MRATELATEDSRTEKGEHSGTFDGVAQGAPRRERHGAALGLSNSSGGHTTVDGIQHDKDPSWSETVHESLRDLLGEALLELRARAKSFNHTSYLAKPDDSALGNIGDMGNAGERKQVVFADRTEVDIANEHEFAELILG